MITYNAIYNIYYYMQTQLVKSTLFDKEINTTILIANTYCILSSKILEEILS